MAEEIKPLHLKKSPDGAFFDGCVPIGRKDLVVSAQPPDNFPLDVHDLMSSGLGYRTSDTSSKASSGTRMPVVWVSHSSITSRSGKRPVTDATRIRCLNCPGRSEVARRVVMPPLCQDCTGIVLNLERVRPGPPDKGISRPYLMFTENDLVRHIQKSPRHTRYRRPFFCTRIRTISSVSVIPRR